MNEILETIDWSPLFISLKTGILATVLAFFAGIAAARFIMKLNNTAKAVVDGLLTLPLVLPPTVAGFFLLLIFSLRRPFGKYLYTQFDIKLVQTWPGCVIAALVIAFPLMYRNARAAFEQIDVNVIYAGRTLGMSERKIFWKVVVPMAAPGLASGTVLAFARSSWRIWGNFHACRKYSWKNQNGIRGNCFGGRRRKLGYRCILGLCDCNFIVPDCGTHQSDIRKKYEKCEQVDVIWHYRQR